MAAHDAGSALVSEIAKHWRVCEDTARRILKKAGLTPVGDGWDRYRWDDIWRLEKDPFVPHWDWARYREPLLTAADLAAEAAAAGVARGASERAMRRRLQSGRIPAIMLTPARRRARRCVWERICGHL